MRDGRLRDDTEERLARWGDRREAVRAILLTSTRAVPGAEVDAFSDYDAVLVVRDVRSFAADRGWIGDFGDVLVAYWDPIRPDPDHGLDALGNVTWYADRPRIDFTVWPVALLERVAAAPALPAELDAGYRVLLDKDGLAARLAPPTYAAYVPVPPDEATFLATVNDFLVGAPAVAVALLRDDLLPAKWVLDYDMKHVYLLPMLQWRAACDRGWAAPARALGKGLRKELPPDLCRELRGSYAGGEPAENWAALLRTMALFRRVAREVGERLGYAYPEEAHASRDRSGGPAAAQGCAPGRPGAAPGATETRRHRGAAPPRSPRPPPPRRRPGPASAAGRGSGRRRRCGRWRTARSGGRPRRAAEAGPPGPWRRRGSSRPRRPRPSAAGGCSTCRPGRGSGGRARRTPGGWPGRPPAPPCRGPPPKGGPGAWSASVPCRARHRRTRTLR